jgi:ribonuclease R
LDEEGAIENIVAHERNIAHRLIEEFMLLANETVAQHLEDQQMPTLYRIHEPPDPLKVLEFDEFVTSLGHSLGAGAGGSVTPTLFQKLVERIRGTPEERPIAFLMLRTMQKARYDAMNVGHFGLAAPTYTHFTSPIRRYPDLVVHRTLRELRHTRVTADRREELEDDLPEIGRHTSETEVRASEAEREIMQWKKVRFMADKVGDAFDGYVTGVTPFGLFVELTEHYVEGLVHVSTMADDYYRFSEQSHSLHGENTRKAYRLGDRVTVQVVRVDQERRQIDLAIDDIVEGLRADERRRGPSRSHARVKKEQRKGTPEDRRKRKATKGIRKQRLGKRERAARKR